MALNYSPLASEERLRRETRATGILIVLESESSSSVYPNLPMLGDREGGCFPKAGKQ